MRVDALYEDGYINHRRLQGSIFGHKNLPIIILLLSVLLLLGNCMNDKVLYYNIIYRGWCIGYAYKYIILSLARDLGIPMFRPGDCAAHAPTTTRRHRILYHNNIIMTLYLK